MINFDSEILAYLIPALILAEWGGEAYILPWHHHLDIWHTHIRCRLWLRWGVGGPFGVASLILGILPSPSSSPCALCIAVRHFLKKTFQIFMKSQTGSSLLAAQHEYLCSLRLICYDWMIRCSIKRSDWTFLVYKIKSSMKWWLNGNRSIPVN